jgi:hypothetical protein
MLDPWANNAVIFLFGLIIGAIASLATLLDPREHNMPRRPGETFIQWQQRVLSEQNRQLEAAPTSVAATGGAFLGVVVVLVVSVLLSPLEMRWWYFLAGLAVGLALLRGVYELAKRGRLGVPINLIAFLSRLPGAQRRGPTSYGT